MDFQNSIPKISYSESTKSRVNFTPPLGQRGLRGAISYWVRGVDVFLIDKNWENIPLSVIIDHSITKVHFLRFNDETSRWFGWYSNCFLHFPFFIKIHSYRIFVIFNILYVIFMFQRWGGPGKFCDDRCDFPFFASFALKKQNPRFFTTSRVYMIFIL